MKCKLNKKTGIADIIIDLSEFKPNYLRHRGHGIYSLDWDTSEIIILDKRGWFRRIGKNKYRKAIIIKQKTKKFNNVIAQKITIR